MIPIDQLRRAHLLDLSRDNYTCSKMGRPQVAIAVAISYSPEIKRQESTHKKRSHKLTKNLPDFYVYTLDPVNLRITTD